MISFRYHLISIVAIFLALAVGLVGGTSLVDERLIDDLEQQRDQLQRDGSVLAGDASMLRAEIALWESFGDRLLLPSLEGQLSGLDVTVILPLFTSDELRVDLRQTLRKAGARVDGEVRLGSRFLLTDDTAAEQLAIAIDAGSARGDELLRAAGEWIGSRSGSAMIAGLAEGPLETADFLEIAEPRTGSSSRHATVVAWDATTENEVLVSSLMSSLLAAAADTEEAVALAEQLDQRPSLAARVRGAAALRRKIATVDHAGSTLGSVALAVAIADLVSERAKVHHYGVSEGSEGVLPAGTFTPGNRPAVKPSPTPTRSGPAPGASPSPSPQASASSS
jgi:hypothetical protein